MLKSNELKVGFLTIITFLILYFGFNFMKGNDLFIASKYYYAEYENVDGLLVSNSVMLNGVEVGKVKSVGLKPGSLDTVLVQLRVDESLIIPNKTKAILADGALLGGKIIRLELQGSGDLPSNSFLIPSTEQGLSTLLKERAIPVLNNADSLLISFRSISSKFENTGTELNALLANSNEAVLNMNSSVRTLMEDNAQNIRNISSNLNQLSQDLVKLSKDIQPIVGNLNNLTDSLQAMKLKQTVGHIDHLVTNLQAITSDLQAGKGTAGQLMKNDSLYNELNSTLVNLDKLLLDFRLEPKRYLNISVFGGKTKPPKVK